MSKGFLVRRVLMAFALVAVTVIFSAAPQAAAQGSETGNFLQPEGKWGGPEVASAPCPSGSTLLFSFADASRGLRYCSAPDGWVPITTEAECDASNTTTPLNGLNGDPARVSGRGFWIPAAELCFGGGDLRPVGAGGLDKATACPLLPQQFFVQDVMVKFPDGLQGPADVCVIPVYKQAATVASGAGATLVTSTQGVISDLLVKSADTAPDIPLDGSSSTPAAEAMPYGLFEFNVTNLTAGETVVVTLNLPALAAGAAQPTEYWKLHNNVWSKLSTAVFNTGANTVALTLTDGGIGDADGLANGTIVDPGGPVVIAAAAAGSKVILRSALPACIESAKVQGDPAAAGLGVGGEFRAADGLLYRIMTGGPTCAFNCADGFDMNCDGRLGDSCAVELNVNTVKGVGGCLAAFGVASAAPVDAAAEASPAAGDSVVATTELAVTGDETGLLRDLGFAIVGLGAATLALGTTHRRRKRL